jgi:hypothetical protein
MSLRLLPLVVGAAVALGCGGNVAGVTTAQAVGAVQERDRPSSAQAPVKPTTEPECQIDAEIAAATRLRGLPVLAPIRCQVLDRKTMAKQALQTALRDTPKPWLEGQTQWLILLGLASDGFDLVPAIGSLLDEQLAGFYDPEQKVLFVSPDTADRMTLIHEIVHALQDQHFDLGKHMREAKTSDALSALQILAEGDATSAMLEIPRDKSQSTAAMAAAMDNVGAFLAEAMPTDVPVPPILKRSLIAPYTDGFAAVERLRAQGDWDAVNALWAQAPSSSAALLSDQPLLWGNTVKQSAGPSQALPEAPAWRPNVPALYDDVTGEQSLRVVFEEWLSRAKAAEAARGWWGDRLTVWSDGGTSALLWHTQWSNERDTEEAWHAFVKGYFPESNTAQSGSAHAPEPSAMTILSRCPERTGHPLALVRRNGEIVVVAQSRSAGTTSEVCRKLALWAASAVQPPRRNGRPLAN